MDTLYGNSANPSVNTSNPFGLMTNQTQILNTLNSATNSAFDVQQAQANKNVANLDNSNYANRANVIASARDALLGGAQNGANTGANSAAIMQALMGADQQDVSESTLALQGLQEIAAQRQAAISGNAKLAIDTANSAKGTQATSAGVIYTADKEAQAAANTALGYGVQGMDQQKQVSYSKSDTPKKIVTTG